MNQSLRSIILEGSFFQLSEDETLTLLHQEYTSELDRLKSAYSISAPSQNRTIRSSPSHKNYGTDYDEVNRTLVGILALRWIQSDNYETFVSCQHDPVKLRRGSFNWIREFFQETIKCNEDLFTLVTSMIINDVGKSPTLAADYAKLTGIDISKLNHDLILQLVLRDPAMSTRLLPSLAQLSAEHRDDLLLGIQLGAEFNFGQLAQAENVPASMVRLQTDFHHRHQAFKLRFMEQLLDIAGAAGHIDHTCAKKLIEPIFQGYRNVYEVSTNVISGEVGLREGYDHILTQKMLLLEKAGWIRAKDLSVGIKEDRALMRLLCIGGATDEASANLYCVAFTESRLSNPVYHSLVDDLNVDGSIEQPAVQLTYLPAMCSIALNNTENETIEEKINSLAALLSYVARALPLDQTSPSFERMPKGITVVERDLRKVLQAILESDEFKRDPWVLNEVPIPNGEVANMAPGCNWEINMPVT